MEAFSMGLCERVMADCDACLRPGEIAAAWVRGLKLRRCEFPLPTLLS